MALSRSYKKPTRITTTSHSLIDIIATNNPETIKTANVIPLSIGDHDMVGCVRKINAVKLKLRTIVCRNFSNYNPKALNDTLKLIDRSIALTNTYLDCLLAVKKRGHKMAEICE